ncbi:hypothetical protein JAAARDRAFT_191045 [Jaapia argillacea MUCL 33604]|uniref:Myotubularin phosphatase domain-containing protein n=1 Tax=Jaapia argillacea MUCL 33604 TaxID=933084 RepID=A0A067Q1R3_9AGAM|nr:hypothetical protein JAAARDRAFT_191045 [Jaapia argillacea MUCL 33604]
MDAIRVTKVENVLCSKTGKTSLGTIHLTAHHLIVSYDGGVEEEFWVPYPLISLVTRLPQTLQGRCPLTVRCRTFETFSLVFTKESEAVDVFESVKELTVVTSVQQLYAFYYNPSPPLAVKGGWSIYSPREEFGRMGVGTRTKAWRFTDVNKDYTFCPTYPTRLVVPTKISDTTLQYASKYRSKCRIPVLTYLHWSNYGSITRSSQPMVGLTQSRSVQDEKLIEAVFQSHYSPDSRAYAAPVYGATATNLIIDARPTTNAVANTAKGAGTENMDHYKEAKKAYLGIDNIHVMRDSLAKVVEVLRDTDIMSSNASGDLPGEGPTMAVLDRHTLRRSGWLRHLSAIIEGSLLIIRNVHVNSSHVLIHCSDGWDRTAQLSSLSQLCLDPYYRTMRGFQILIEKDWLSFGHKYLDRCGHLSSEKFFVAPVETTGGGGADAAQAFFASVQKRFVSQSDIKETSPVFHQFLESVRQIQRQYPERFEFNERFLRQLYYHLYSCQFGTFLFNCERERRVGEGGPPPCESTVSVWDYFNSPSEIEKNTNPDYDKSLDDPSSRAPKADMGVLYPNPKNVRFWNELYGRSDEEMNGRAFGAQAQVPGVEFTGPIEGDDDDSAITRSATPATIPLPPSPAKSPPLNLSSSQPAISPLAQTTSSISPVEPSSLVTSSLPDLNVTLTEDPFKLPSSTSSEISLQSHVGNRPHRSSSPTPMRGFTSRAQRPPDWAGGMKSVWGKLSSNASAALTAVQGAYDGVAKDFVAKTLSGPEGDSVAGGELRSRDQITAWVEEPSSPPRTTSPSYTPTTSSNPWVPTSRTNVPSIIADNPWNSVRPPPRQNTDNPWSTASQNVAFNDMPSDLLNSLPVDPTIVQPTPRPSQSRRTSALTPERSSPPVNLPAHTPDRLANSRHIESPRGGTQSNTDPLGVGPL